MSDNRSGKSNNKSFASGLAVARAVRGDMVTLRTRPQGNYGARLRLLEVNEPGILEAMEGGGGVVLKSSHDEDEAVLCTASKTFRVREIYTSNLHLLVREDTGVVEEMTSRLLDLCPIPAKTEQLSRILAAHPYNGEGETEVPDSLARCRVESLFRDVQASDEEICQTLDRMEAILLNGHYRILGSEYTARFLRLLLSTLALHEWSGQDWVERGRLLELLREHDADEFPEPLLVHLLRIYGREDEARERWQMNERTICRFHARELLRARPVWPWAQFRLAWEGRCGDLDLCRGHLEGLALLDADGGGGDDREGLVRALVADELPVDPTRRFGQLFRALERWPLQEMIVYVEGAATALAIPLMDLIGKYCRISTDAGGRQVVTPLLPE